MHEKIVAMTKARQYKILLRAPLDKQTLFFEIASKFGVQSE